MASGTDGRSGTARSAALVLGVVYLGVALVEVVLGSDGLVIGDPASTNRVILLLEPVHNAIHWLTGLILLGSSFAGEATARSVLRVVGLALLALTVVGLVAGELTMRLLGYEGAPAVPISYTILHGVSAAGALYAGFSRQGRPVR
jgi:Domain of unknown function (DUF4383)